MYDAMFREYFEKEDHQYRFDVTATANRIVLITSVIICAVFVFANASFSNLFFGTPIYGSVIIFAAFGMIISSNRQIIAAPTRMQNKRTVYVVSGLLGGLSYYGLAILLIYVGYSYFGLIYANIISAMLLLMFFGALNRKFFTLGKFNIYIAKELFKIGLPLVPVFLIYWVYHSVDRIMITNMLSTTELGIYAIGARVASISTFIYAAFAGGWQYFAFSTMKDGDQVALNSKVFEYLGAISFLSLIVLYPFLRPLFNVLFPATYWSGVVVVPYLYISPLLLMLFQVVGNQFLVIKKSYWSTITLSFGALANVLLNLLLIPFMGIEGAAVATLIGYSLSVVVVCFVTSRLKLHTTSKRMLVACVALIFYLVIARSLLYDSMTKQLILTLAATLVFLYMYRKELYLLYIKAKSLFRRNKSLERMQ